MVQSEVQGYPGDAVTVPFPGPPKNTETVARASGASEGDGLSWPASAGAGLYGCGLSGKLSLGGVGINTAPKWNCQLQSRLASIQPTLTPFCKTSPGCWYPPT